MKKEIVVHILVVVTVLMIGSYILLDNMFPYATPIKQLDTGMIKSYSINDSEGNEIKLGDDEEELKKLFLT